MQAGGALFAVNINLWFHGAASLSLAPGLNKRLGLLNLPGGLRLRRAAVLEAFAACPFTAALKDRGAGLHFLLALNTEEDDEALRQRAEGLGMRLGFLSEYAAVPRPAYAHTLVVNYAGLDADKLPETMALLSEVFRTS